MDFLVPKLSATMESAKVLRWLKRVGDEVRQGEPLVELETDKAAMEVEAPNDGTLVAVLAEDGAEVAVGAPLATLKILGEAARNERAQSSPRALASPNARRLARLNGVDLDRLAAANPDKRLRGRDVERAKDEAAKTSQAERTTPLSPMRAEIAAAVSLSRRTIPAFTLDRFVETTVLDHARETANVAAASGERLSLTDLLLHAAASALAQHRALLGRFTEAGGRPSRVSPQSVDIGLVVALPDGLALPVLRDVERASLGEIARLRQAAVERARAGRLVQEDWAPVSFSISNLGPKGPDRFEAIIYPGQTAILAVGRCHERVVARSSAIAVAAGINLTLSVDHRLIDGVAAASFLETLAQRIEGYGV